MKHLNFQALAENKVLKVTGVKHASEVATCLQVKGFGEIIKEGSQSFFHINTVVFFDRLEDVNITKEVIFISTNQ